MPKISELNELTSLYSSDYIAVAHDTAGLPSTKKITVRNLANTISANVIAKIPTASNTVSGTLKIGGNYSVNSTGFLQSTSDVLPDGAYEGQILIADNTGNPTWKFNPVFDATTVINYTTAYTATKDDNYILCDTNDVSANITITLPTSVPQGKEYNIKQLTGAGVYKVTITTSSPSSRLIENPVTGELVQSYDILHKGELESWIHDGNVYRHTGSQTGSPVFVTGANTYHQVVVKNADSGPEASGDLVVYNNQGDYIEGNGPYIDLGINSSTYANTEYSINGPSDAYLYNEGGDLTIGTANNGTSVIIHSGGTTSDKAKLVVNSTAIFANTDYIPTQNNIFNLGSATKQWKSLYVSNNTIYIGGIPVTVNASGELTVNGSTSTGFTGSSGTTGFTGSVGTTGFTGSVGTTGFTGSSGTTGFAGSIGTTGFTGSTGYAGSSGSIRTITSGVVSGPTVITSEITFADPNAAGANVVLVLPSSPTTGSVYTVKNINTGSSVLFVQTDGVNAMETESGSIGTGVYATISVSGNYITWVYDGSSLTYRVIG